MRMMINIVSPVLLISATSQQMLGSSTV